MNKTITASLSSAYLAIFPRAIGAGKASFQKTWMYSSPRPIRISEAPGRYPDMAANIESTEAFRSTQFIHTKQEAKVLAALRDQPAGLTRAEIATVANLKLQSVCPRCDHLLSTGAICKKPLPVPADGRAYERRRTGRS
jgi:hypothetical protein